MTREPENWFAMTKLVIPRACYTERIYIQFTSQNPRDRTLVRNSGKFVLRGLGISVRSMKS